MQPSVSRGGTGVGVIELTQTLKRCLKARGITYAALASKLGLSEASVKRLFSERSFTINRVEAICAVMGLDFYELARLAHGPETGESRLSVAQERALAADPKLLLVFQLLLNDWGAEDVLAQYALSRAEWTRLLRSLERLQLATVLPSGLVRLRVGKRVAWREGGPVRRAYQKLVLDEFFKHPFSGRRADLHFEGKELSAASLVLMRRKIKRLVHDMNELAEVDASLKPTQRTSVGMVVAVRPYVLSVFTRYSRRRGGVR